MLFHQQQFTNFQPKYIDVVILCGGNKIIKSGDATKLQCMLNVERRPFLSYIIDQLSAFDFEKVIFAVDEHSRDLRKHFEDRYAFIDFRYSYEDYPLGTLGAAKKAIIEHGCYKDVLIIKGNIYTHFDIFDMRNYYDEYVNCKRICSLSYDDKTRLSIPQKNEIDDKNYYSAGFYYMQRDYLLELPDICAFKDIEIENHFILKRDKNKSIDINIVKNNQRNVKFFFRDIWGYDWSRYNYFDDGIKKCLYCIHSHRIKLSKGKYHGWKMKCSLYNNIVERMSFCEDFDIRGDKPYLRTSIEEGKI